MTENIKKVSNPLTIIAIFAGIAEVAGTVALKLVSENHQGIFLVFVMGFPTLLVILFFVTLNFNQKVLYAPGDFKDEEIFYKMIAQKEEIDINLENITEILNKSKEDIVKETLEKTKDINKSEQEYIRKMIDNKFSVIENAINETKNTTGEIGIRDNIRGASTVTINQMIQYLKNHPDSSIRDAANYLGVSVTYAFQLLKRAEIMGLVAIKRIPGDGSIEYTFK